MSEEELTPFGKALQEIAERRGMTLEQVMALTLGVAEEDGIPGEVAWEDLRAMVYVSELERRRQEVLDGEYGDLGFGQPN